MVLQDVRSTSNNKMATHLCCIVFVAIGPYQVEVVLEFALGLVLFILELPGHGRKVHGVGDDCDCEFGATTQVKKGSQS